jgi:cephalosporin hydroxylase
MDWNIPSLKKYVRRCENKDEGELKKAADEWLIASAKNRIDYESEWLGVPVIQTPEDILLMQELIFRVQPDFIVETGVAHGGGLIYYASLMELLGKGKMIGVELEMREHNRKVVESHPMSKRIEIVQGDSVSEGTIQKLRSMIPEHSRVIVCLDSNHTKPHVLKELKLYQQFVMPGSYMVVFDTNTSRLAEQGVCDKEYLANGPGEAVAEFLKTNDNFVIDKEFNKLYVSTSPDGYLKRIK